MKTGNTLTYNTNEYTFLKKNQDILIYTVLGNLFEYTKKVKKMGFLTNLISATVKTVIAPVAIVKDVVDVATGKEPENTKNLLKSAAKDAGRAGDTMIGENNDGLL